MNPGHCDKAVGDVGHTVPEGPKGDHESPSFYDNLFIALPFFSGRREGSNAVYLLFSALITKSCKFSY